MPGNEQTTMSPFHRGERAVQSRAGARDRMAEIGKVVIRPFMPDQHREFFAQLPFVVLGSVDARGWPWASILSGSVGFASSPQAQQLVLDAAPLADDPLAANLTLGAPLGVLGIELATRRRNRVNGRVAAVADGGVTLDVVQSFGNCPKYIQTRNITLSGAHEAENAPVPSQSFRNLDAPARALIAASDTFFVASHVHLPKHAFADGVDVSHRGGKAGFVKIAGDMLTIPDFAGNRFFNTIGNFVLNPRAGLIFADFTTGDLLMLAGKVDVLWEDHPDVVAFKGAERAWRFTLDHGLRIYDALPFRAVFGEWSRQSLETGEWGGRGMGRKDDQ